MLLAGLPTLSVWPPISILVPGAAAFKVAAAFFKMSMLSGEMLALPVAKWITARFNAFTRSSPLILPAAASASILAAAAAFLALSSMGAAASTCATDVMLNLSPKMDLSLPIKPSISPCGSVPSSVMSSPSSVSFEPDIAFSSGKNLPNIASQFAPLAALSTPMSPLAASPKAALIASSNAVLAASSATVPE